MSDRARKLAKKRQKREQKRRDIRKAQSGSPIKRAAGGALVECWINDNWFEAGQAVPYVVRRTPGGISFATFMIDTWCAGLKDAWGKLDLTLEELHEMLDGYEANTPLRFRKCDLKEAADLVAAAVRFANQNGFRLPKNWEKWAAFCGPIDVASADLSKFGKDGGLLWTGPMHDLRSRLIGSTVDAFFARPDVHFVTEPGPGDLVFERPEDLDEELDEEEDEEPEKEKLDMEEVYATIQRSASDVVDSVRAWCLAEGKTPSPLLPEAAVASLVASIKAYEPADGAEPAESPRTRWKAALERWVENQPPEKHGGYREAILQIEQTTMGQSLEQFLASPGRRS